MSQHVSKYTSKNSTPKYGNKRLQGFRPGYGQGHVRDLVGHLKPKVLYQKNTPSPMIKLSCGKTQNDSTSSSAVSQYLQKKNAMLPRRLKTYVR